MNKTEKAYLFFITVLIVFMGLAYYWEAMPERLLMVLAVFVILSAVLSLVMQAIGFFSKYEHKKEYLGELEISSNHIRWQNEIIKWQDVRSFSIAYTEIEGELDLAAGKWENNISDGINEIRIVKKDSRVFNAHYLIESHFKASKLLDILKETVEQGEIDYNLAKQLVVPQNYKEHQELKRRLGKG